MSIDQVSRSARLGQEHPTQQAPAHPVRSPVGGFLTGMVLVVVLPALALSGVHSVLGYRMTEQLAPLLTLLLVLPLGLAASRRTRTFGLYLALGMLVMLLVVVGVSAAVVWMMLGR